MSQPAERLPTFEELYEGIAALRPGLTGEILSPGTLRVMSRPGKGHRLASWRIRRGLEGSDMSEGGSGWWLEVEAEIRFSELLYVPDLSGWRCDDEPSFVEENPIVVRPDWVCEIMSRSTQRGDRAEKLPNYAAAGVGHAWVVDPQARSVEVYELDAGRYRLVTTAHRDETVVLAPFPEPMQLARWWAVDR